MAETESKKKRKKDKAKQIADQLAAVEASYKLPILVNNNSITSSQTSLIPINSKFN